MKPPINSKAVPRTVRAEARPQVALLIETSNAYARGLLEGVAAYLREHRPWSIYLSEHGRGESIPAWLHRWKGDGIIARVENASIAKAVMGRALPTVDLSAGRLLKNAPCVETDNAAIARLAARHLLDRGFRRLGFCGITDYAWARLRMEHFQHAAREAGLDCHVHMVGKRADSAAHWLKDQRDLARWVTALPKPVGIMACFDIRGRQLLDACRTAGIRVPDDVAVVGVDDDALLCELADPPLSSIAPDTHRTGYMAAELLDRMLAGHVVLPALHLIAPLHVVARRSSDALAIDDPDVSVALRFIREHACDGVTVQDLLRHVPLSRRVLEARFIKTLGRSPHQEILRCRIEHVKKLLSETDLPFKAIAKKSGFAHTEYLSVAFKRLTGTRPSEHRRSARDLSAPPR